MTTERCDHYIGNADESTDCEYARGHDGPHSFESPMSSVAATLPVRVSRRPSDDTATLTGEAVSSVLSRAQVLRLADDILQLFVTDEPAPLPVEALLEQWATRSDPYTRRCRRELDAALRVPRSAPIPAETNQQLSDRREAENQTLWQESYARGDQVRSAPIPLDKHRCSGCGHRWDGALSGAELCGDCWRKAQPRFL